MKQIAGIVKTQTQNRKEIYKMLKMDKVPDCTNVLLAFLGHPRFIKMFKEDHPSSKIEVLESKDLAWLYDGLDYEAKLVNPVNIKEIKEILKDMKFDYIIMNPPYNGSLHLQILKEAMKHGQKTISLEPNFYELYKTDYSNIRKPLSLTIVKREEAEKLFKIELPINLGIFEFSSEEEGNIDFQKLYTPKAYNILSKLKYNKSFKDVNVEQYSGKGIFVPLKLMTSTWDKQKNIVIAKIGILQDGKTSSNIEYREALNRNKNRPVGGIYFDTVKEAENFIKTCNTQFFQTWVYLMHTSSRYVLGEYPYMGNEINPRTGLKGYESEWTDEDFYKFFNLSSDEIKIIEDTMEKYK